jgi:hypothetical protein
LKQNVNQSNWLIGENIMLGDNYALRSLAAPGTAFLNHPQWGDDPQPATMDQFNVMPNTEDGDWGGVHINSAFLILPSMLLPKKRADIHGKQWPGLVRCINRITYQHIKFPGCQKPLILQSRKIFGRKQGGKSRDEGMENCKTLIIMTHIKLRRSGGQLGRTLQSTMEIDIEEKELIKALKEVANSCTIHL